MLEIYLTYIEDPVYEEDLTRLTELKDFVLASNEAINLFEFYFKQSDFTPHATNFHNLAKEVSFRVEYETIYGEKRTFTVRSLTD